VEQDKSKSNNQCQAFSTANHEPEKEIRDTGYNLEWVDEFIRRIKPYIYVRELDKLLILIPNQAYKLNDTGVGTLSFLLKGRSIDEFLDIVGDSTEKRRELHYFFCDLRAAVSGCLREDDQREAVSYYEFQGAFTQYPVLSEIAVTYRCNLRCDFCYVGNRDYDELKTNDVKKILFKILNQARVPSVSFTGGEPLLRHDIVSLVKYAVHLGLWTNIITNGTLLNNDIVEKLKKSGLSSAQVSVEGPVSQVHDRITGVSGSFQATVEGIRLLQKAGIPVHTNTTITKNNIDHIMDIIPLVKGMGLKRLSMNLCIPCGNALDRKDIWVSYEEIGDHILALKRRADQENIRFLWYSPIPMCIFNPVAYGFGNKSCAAITGLLSIDPMGNIIPCSSWRRPVASLLKSSFEDIWGSSVLSFFKNIDYAPDECHGCLNFDICKGACPLYWAAKGKGELLGRT
jgi:radical SAM protein with 4Fe4S-binding SPASM domain